MKKINYELEINGKRVDVMIITKKSPYLKRIWIGGREFPTEEATLQWSRAFSRYMKLMGFGVELVGVHTKQADLKDEWAWLVERKKVT